jgi:hypothetical protein
MAVVKVVDESLEDDGPVTLIASAADWLLAAEQLLPPPKNRSHTGATVRGGIGLFTLSPPARLFCSRNWSNPGTSVLTSVQCFPPSDGTASPPAILRCPGIEPFVIVTPVAPLRLPKLHIPFGNARPDTGWPWMLQLPNAKDVGPTETDRTATLIVP